MNWHIEAKRRPQASVSSSASGKDLRSGTAQQARADLAAALDERSEFVAKRDDLETQLGVLATEAALGQLGCWSREILVGSGARG